MAETAINYATPDLTESLILHILPDFGLHGDGIINSNLLTAFLNQKGVKKVQDGGLEWWFGIMKNENTNAQWQGKNDDMTVLSQDPSDRLRFPIKVFTDNVVVNDLEKAQNKSKAMIKNYVETLMQQARTTILNRFNSGWWTLSPGANEPASIPSIISNTPTSGTVGGLERAGNAYLQNGLHDANISDIGSEAGIGTIYELRIKYAVGQSLADLIIMDEARFANLAGYLHTQKRYAGNETMAKLAFETIKLGAATIGFENRNNMGSPNTITSGYMYGINTKFLQIKTLKDGDSKWATQFERKGVTMNRHLPFYWFGNLTTNNPRANWVATDLT